MDSITEMARRIADEAVENHAAAKGTHTWEIAREAALAAIKETTERCAKVADRYHAACVPKISIGDDDSIYLTDYEEGEKRASYVIREKLRAGEHLKG